MIENYMNYLWFFIISTIIFSIMGLIIRTYTGTDWYGIITRIIVVVIMIIFMIWAMTVENETTEQLTKNMLTLVYILLYVFIPLILGEIISASIYKLIDG